MKEKLNNLEKTILLILLFSKNELYETDFILYDLIFLINYQTDKLNINDFEFHSYGIYSKKVSDALFKLIEKNYIELDDDILILTYKSKKIIPFLLENTDKELLESIKENVNLFNDLNLFEILTYLYYKYPEYFNNIKRLKIIEKNKEKLALNLYKKNKISLNALSEILNIPIEKTVDLLKEKNLI